MVKIVEIACTYMYNAYVSNDNTTYIRVEQ